MLPTLRVWRSRTFPAGAFPELTEELLALWSLSKTPSITGLSSGRKRTSLLCTWALSAFPIALEEKSNNKKLQNEQCPAPANTETQALLLQITWSLFRRQSIESFYTCVVWKRAVETVKHVFLMMKLKTLSKNCIIQTHMYFRTRVTRRRPETQ